MTTIKKAINELESAVEQVIETVTGDQRPVSKTKTLREGFKSQKKENYVSDKKLVTLPKSATVKVPVESKKITFKNKANPHLASSKRAKHWEKLLNCKTTEDFKKAKGRMNLIPGWVASGHITLS